MASQRFTCVEDGASKFWEVAVEGVTLTVRYGKLGTDGQTKVKTLATAELAEAERAKLIREKTKKGYVADDGDGPAPATPAARPAAPAAKAPATAAPAPAAKAPAANAPAAPAPASPAPAGPASAIPGARTFVRDPATWRIGTSAEGTLEQVDDEPVRPGKKLTSGDAILRAVDAAIAKRVAEGFSESTATPAPDAPPMVHLDAAALALVHPLRRVPGPPRPVDVAAAWATIQAARSAIRDYLDEAPDAAEDHARAEVDAALAWLGRSTAAPLPGDDALAMAAFLLAAHPAPETLEALVDVVVAEGDAARATAALVGHLRRCDAWVVLPRGDDALRQQPGADLASGPGAWRVLRAHLAHAPEEVHRRAHGIAGSARAGASRALRVAVAYAFPDTPEWAHEEARAAIIRGDAFAPERWLLTAATDGDVLYRLAHDAVPVDVTWRARDAEATRALAVFRKKPWTMGLDAIGVIDHLSGAPVDDVPLTMVAAAGDAAVLALELLRDRAVHSQDGRMPHELAAQDAILRALACLPTDAALEKAIGYVRSYAESRRGTPGALPALLRLADLAPRRTLAALIRDREEVPHRAVDPMLARLERDLAARLGAGPAAATSSPAAATTALPPSALGAALQEGDPRGILAALETATAEDLAAAESPLDAQLAGLVDVSADALVDVLERRFATTWPGARILGDVHLLRQNPQFQANVAAAFLQRTDHEEAFAYALACLGADSMIRELDDALEAHWKRPRGKAERAKRAGRIAEAATTAGEAEYAARWQERAAG